MSSIVPVLLSRYQISDSLSILVFIFLVFYLQLNHIPVNADIEKWEKNRIKIPSWVVYSFIVIFIILLLTGNIPEV